MDNKYKRALAGAGALAAAGCADGQMMLYENGVYHFYSSGRGAEKDAILAKHGYTPASVANQKLTCQKKVDAEKISKLEEYIRNADNARAVMLQDGKTNKQNLLAGGLITGSSLAIVLMLGYLAARKYVFHR